MAPITIGDGTVQHHTENDFSHNSDITHRCTQCRIGRIPPIPVITPASSDALPESSSPPLDAKIWNSSRDYFARENTALSTQRTFAKR